MNRRVLIVDESKSFRRVFFRMLKHIDPELEIVEASNGVEAVKHCRESSLNFIFLSAEMPNRDGWDALEAIRDLDCQAKVYVVSSSSQGLDQRKATKMGADGFVPKPLPYLEFVKLLRVPDRTRGGFVFSRKSVRHDSLQAC